MKPNSRPVLPVIRAVKYVSILSFVLAATLATIFSTSLVLSVAVFVSSWTTVSTLVSPVPMTVSPASPAEDA